MLKLYMNAPFETTHELAQAKKLHEILSQEYDGNESKAWLCFNFSLGGKSLDAALLTQDKFVIIEFKAVGGFVDCGTSIENSQWSWQDSEFGPKHIISTKPYLNPFSQVKNYRTAVIGELSHRQSGFLKNVTLLKGDVNFAWWVKSCVLVSGHNAEDVKIISSGLPTNVARWFCYGTIGNAHKVMKDLRCSVSVEPKEIRKLIEKVIGLRPVEHIMEAIEIAQHEIRKPATSSQVFLDPSRPSELIKAFYRKYEEGVTSTSQKAKARSKGNEGKWLDDRTVKDLTEIDKLIVSKPVETEIMTKKKNDGFVVAAERVFKAGFWLATLKGDLAELGQQCGSVEEMHGDKAIAEVQKVCPDIGRFEVSVVLHFKFENVLSESQKENVREYFKDKYASSAKWHCIAFPKEGVDFIFGEPLESQGDATNASQVVPCEKSINSGFLPAAWLKDFVERQAEGLPPLSVQEVQQTTALSPIDVKRYARTYLSRSCAEAFVILDWVLGSERISSGISLLDVGCGSGGASLGCVLALRKHGAADFNIRIDGIDVNRNSLQFASCLYKYYNEEYRGHIVFNPIQGNVTKPLKFDGKYDIVIASKSLGEVGLSDGNDICMTIAKDFAGKIGKNGILLIIDLLKHEEAVKRITESCKDIGFDGWCRRLTIDIDSGNDNEEFVCACIMHVATKTNSTKE